MSDPERFYEGSEMSLERTLLLAARGERPGRRARYRAAVALGVGGGAWASFSSTASAAAQFMKEGMVGIGKWIALGIVGSGALAGAYQLSLDRGAADEPQLAGDVLPKRADAGQSTLAGTPLPTVAVDSLPVEPASDDESSAVAPNASSKSNRRAAAGPRAAESIADQIARLDSIRASLASGRATAALAMLDEYRRVYPHGAFGQEAALFRIEALVKSGQTQSARTFAQRFERAHPNSPHIKRIRASLGQDDSR